MAVPICYFSQRHDKRSRVQMLHCDRTLLIFFFCITYSPCSNKCDRFLKYLDIFELLCGYGVYSSLDMCVNCQYSTCVKKTEGFFLLYNLINLQSPR